MQRVMILKFCNQLQKYKPETVLSMNDKKDISVVSSANKSSASIGTEGLDREHSQKIPLGYSSLLGGTFANKVLASRYPEWNQKNDFERLVSIGTRSVGNLRVVVEKSEALPESSDQPIIGKAKLVALLDQIYIATSKNDLKDLLDSNNFYSITSTQGRTPQIEYQDDEGHRWTVKECRIGGAMAEYSLTQIQHWASITSQESSWFAHNDREYIMTKRFDLKQPVRQDSSSVYDHNYKASNINISTLLNLARIRGDDLENTYPSIISVMKEHVEDIEKASSELYKRALFNLLINNEQYGLENISLTEAGDGEKFVLAPAGGVRVHSGNYKSQIPIVTGYETPEWVKFDEDFFKKAASDFDLPVDKIKSITSTVAKSFKDLERKFARNNLPSDGIEHVKQFLRNGQIKEAEQNSLPKYDFDQEFQAEQTSSPTQGM